MVKTKGFKKPALMRHDQHLSLRQGSIFCNAQNRRKLRLRFKKHTKISKKQ
jgi:hypothetical protein